MIRDPATQLFSSNINDDNTEAAFSLQYATNRFIQTINPASEREESSFAFAAQRNTGRGTTTAASSSGSKSATVTVIAQSGPHSQNIQKLIKYCTNCKKHYHVRAECDLITGKSRQKNTNTNSGGNSGGNSERKQR